MSSRVSAQDKREFEKFTTNFIYKSIQIIIQSRLGDKIKTKSKPFASSTDWFNLAICDSGEVQAEAKKVLAGQSSLLAQNVCVEISLQTAEGDTMVLEIWYISLDTSQCDEDTRMSQLGYYRMGIALKSLLTVSRVTPAYRLSRRQSSCATDYVICYRIYLGDAQFYILGDGYQKSKVGSVPTQVGTVSVNLAYRTKLLISPRNRAKATPIEMKDDHFQPVICTDCMGVPKPCPQTIPGRQSETDLGILSHGPSNQTFFVSPSEKFSERFTSHHQSQPIRIVIDPTMENNEELECKAKRWSEDELIFELEMPMEDLTLESSSTNTLCHLYELAACRRVREYLESEPPSIFHVDHNGCLEPESKQDVPESTDCHETSMMPTRGQEPRSGDTRLWDSVSHPEAEAVDSVEVKSDFDDLTDEEWCAKYPLDCPQFEFPPEYWENGRPKRYPDGKNLLGRTLFGGAFAQQYRLQQEDPDDDDDDFPLSHLLRTTKHSAEVDRVDDTPKRAETVDDKSPDKSNSEPKEIPEENKDLCPCFGGPEEDPSGGAVGPIMKLSEEDRESFVMINKVAAFGRGGPDDLGQFFRDLQNAPNLFVEENPRSVREVYDELCSDIDFYAGLEEEFDAFSEFVQNAEPDGPFGPVPDFT